MKRGQDPRWPKAHINLKRIYDERIPAGMSQEEFGAKYEIGSQSMVWQLLNGYVPLSYEQAFKFANGLHCTIHDISPEMDDWCKAWMLPALGVKLRKRVAAALLALTFLPAAPDAFSHNQISPVQVPPKILHKYLIKYTFYAIRRLSGKLLRGLAKPSGWFVPFCTAQA